ncbi:hypothetical protein [Streptomyces sp. NPDC004728]|uniref:hypothetical protein n=1 Tax=Streptomyces sp. NPDC004728 TaxID=3154289 RepID=UPI0033B186F1
MQPTEKSIRLHLESDASFDSLLAGLLPGRVPVGTGRDEIHGLNGLRIAARSERGIELCRLGQPAGTQLTGPSRRAFHKAEGALAEQIHADGGEASWLAGDTWTTHERLWEDERQPLAYESTWHEAAWLPSGLLRRLDLLHTVAVPHLVTGHEARLGEWWILELDHASDTGLRRAELVQALAHPEHGLPLELRGHRDLTPDESLGLVLLKSPDTPPPSNCATTASTTGSRRSGPRCSQRSGGGSDVWRRPRRRRPAVPRHVPDCRCCRPPTGLPGIATFPDASAAIRTLHLTPFVHGPRVHPMSGDDSARDLRCGTGLPTAPSSRRASPLRFSGRPCPARAGPAGRSGFRSRRVRGQSMHENICSPGSGEAPTPACLEPPAGEACLVLEADVPSAGRLGSFASAQLASFHTVTARSS